MEFNYDKLKAATHYICARANDTGRTVDETQLNKILWYADALTYMSRGQPITGTTYKRKPRGPVAARRNTVLKELIDDGCVREGHATRGGDFVSVLDAISPPDTSCFGKAELELLDRVQQYVATEVSTREVSEQSHGEIWKLARDGEEIPLYTVFAETLGVPTAKDLEDARRGEF